MSAPERSEPLPQEERLGTLRGQHKFSISGTAPSSYYHDQFTAKFVPSQSYLRVQLDVDDNTSKLGLALGAAPAGMLTVCWRRQFDSLTSARPAIATMLIVNTQHV